MAIASGSPPNVWGCCGTPWPNCPPHARGRLHLRVRAAETRRQLHSASADVSFERDLDDPTRFKAIELVFRLHGPSREEAEDLVGYLASRCPIYNMLSRGGPIEIAIAEPE
jgi:uncharacterized OsmC-like protein